MVKRHAHFVIAVGCCLFAWIMVGSFTQVIAQSDVRYGATAGYDIDLHAAKFAKLTSLGYCCPTDFGAANGSTMYAGLTVEMPPIPSLASLLTLSLGVGYQQRGLNTAFAATTYVNDPETNQGRDGLINYTMQLQRSDVYVDVLPRIALTSALRVGLGARVGYAISSSLVQREELGSDLIRDGYYFIDPSTQEKLPYRNIYSGQIPDVASLSVAMSAGLSYDIRLNALGTTILTPGIWYRFQPSGFSSNVTSRTVDPATGVATEQPGSWSIQSFGASLSLAFTSAPTVQLDPCQQIVNGEIVSKRCPQGTVLRINPITGECGCEDTLRVDTTIVTIDGIYQRSNGVIASTALDRINVVRSPQVNYLPIMYAVVFNQGSSNVDVVNKYIDVSPERKQTFMKERSFTRLYQKHLFNVVGSRFADGSVSKLTIVGFAHESESNPDALALERAVKVREHLYRRWGIPLTSFTIRAATKEERTLYAGGLPSQYDQRMALLYLNDQPRVVDFVQFEDKYVSVEPDSIRVRVRIDLGETKSIASLDYQVKLGGNTGGKMVQPVRAVINAGDALFPDAREGWDVPLDGPQSEIGTSLQSLPVGDGAKLIPSLRVTSSSGQTVEAQRSNATSVIPIRVRELTPATAERGDSIYTSVSLLDLPASSAFLADQQRSLVSILERHYRQGVRTNLSATAVRSIQSTQSSATTTQELINILLNDMTTTRVDQPWLSARIEHDDPTGISIYKAASLQEVIVK